MLRICDAGRQTGDGNVEPGSGEGEREGDSFTFSFNTDHSSIRIHVCACMHVKKKMQSYTKDNRDRS